VIDNSNLHRSHRTQQPVIRCTIPGLRWCSCVFV